MRHLDSAATNAGSIDGAFGLDRDDDEWLTRLRQARQAEDRGPMRLGEYEIVGVAGRGGQGIVYRARQPRTGRDIALKRLSAGVFATPAMHARFGREVEAAAALDHPGIVTVYGSEIVAGQPVLALQWIDGAPFDEWAARSAAGDAPPEARRDAREVLEAFALACDAVHHAHRRGVIHRDLKPSNVLVDAENRPHVLDFGLAKLSDASGADIDLTRTGTFIGTPAYAAPELAVGRFRDVDVRTDVYSLGALLHEALTGETPHDSAQEWPQLLADIQHRSVLPPSSRRAGLDREIDAIVLKALEKERERRYESVADLAADVRRYLAGESVRAHPPTRAYRARKFLRRHALATFVAAAFAVTLSGAATLSTILYFRSDADRKKAIAALDAESKQLEATARERDNVARQWNRARGAEVLLEDLLSRAHRGASGGAPVLTVREALDQFSADLSTNCDDYLPEVEAWVRMRLGGAYADLNLPALAKPHFERAVLLRTRLFGRTNLEVAESLEKLGRACRVLDEMEDAGRHLEAALDIRRELTSSDNGFIAMSANSLAILKRRLGRLDEAEALFIESLRHYEAIGDLGSDSVPVVMKNLAQVHLDANRPEKAIELLSEAESLAYLLHGDDHPDVATCRSTIAGALHRLRLHDAAEARARQATATLLALFGDRDPRLASAQEVLANILTTEGRLDEADELLTQAIATHDTAQRAADRIRCVDARARIRWRQGFFAEAEAGFREALNLACEAYPATHETPARQMAALGRFLLASRRRDEAEVLLLRAEPALAFGDSPEAARAVREDLLRLRESR